MYKEGRLISLITQAKVHITNQNQSMDSHQLSLLPSVIHLPDDESNEKRMVFKEQKMISEDILKLVENCCKENPKSLTAIQRSQIIEFLGELDIKEASGETTYLRVYEDSETINPENTSVSSTAAPNDAVQKVESPQMKELKNLFEDDDDCLQVSHNGVECTLETCDVVDFAKNLYLPPKYNLMTMRLPEVKADTSPACQNHNDIDHFDTLCGDNCLPCGSPNITVKKQDRLEWSNEKKEAAEQFKSYLATFENGHDSVDDIPVVFQQLYYETSFNTDAYSRIIGLDRQIDLTVTLRNSNNESTGSVRSSICNDENIPYTQSDYLDWDNATSNVNLMGISELADLDEDEDYRNFFLGIQHVSSNLVVNQEQNNSSDSQSNDAAVQTDMGIFNSGSSGTGTTIIDRGSFGSNNFILQPLLPTEQLEPVNNPLDNDDIPVSLFPKEKSSEQSIEDFSSDEISDDESDSSSNEKKIPDSLDAEESIPYDPDVFYSYFTPNLLRMPDGQLPPGIDVSFEDNNKLP